MEACGLKLSLGKTNFEKRWFSLNSSFFVAGRCQVRSAPVVRSTAVFKPLPEVRALKGRLDALRCLHPSRRIVWEKLLLSRVMTSVWAGQLSLRRGLGCRVSRRAIIELGLRDRELFYESLPSSMDHDPVVVHNYLTSAIPKGWYQIRTSRRSQPPREFLEALVDECWYPDINPVSGREQVLSQTMRYVRKRPVGLLSMVKGPLRRMCFARREELCEVSRVGFPAWRRTVGGSLWQRPLLFRRGR